MESITVDTRAVDALFAEWDGLNTPGCVVGILHAGQLVYGRAFGSADLQRRQPLTMDTRMDIGSTAKQFTAACIGLLVLRGQMRLEDELQQYLPEFPCYDRPITIGNLVYHTSGLRDHSMIAILGGMTIEDYQDNASTYAIACRQSSLNFPPGSAHGYSNTNYLLLAEVVQRVTGLSLRAFAEENLFRPLGMAATCFNDSPAALPDPSLLPPAWGYHLDGDGAYIPYHRQNYEVGATNLWTTLEDLCRWEANSHQLREGSPELVQLMHTTGRLADGQPVDYGFGIVLGEHHGLKTISHAGAWGGFRAELLRFPEQQLTIIVQTNFEDIIPTRLAFKVADLCLDELMAQQSAPPASGETISIPAEQLFSLAGVYRSTLTGETTELMVQDDQLKAESNGRIFRLGAQRLEVQEVEFQVLDVPYPIRLVCTRQDRDWQITRHFPGMPPEPFLPAAADVGSQQTLHEYCGLYTHPDLLTGWDISLQGKQLQVVYGRAERDLLKPAGKDCFRAPNITFQFLRDDTGRVTGLCFDTERVRSITMTRVEDPA
jgi:CubicO group peptidase (beta-lactamase class C family)